MKQIINKKITIIGIIFACIIISFTLLNSLLAPLISYADNKNFPPDAISASNEDPINIEDNEKIYESTKKMLQDFLNANVSEKYNLKCIIWINNKVGMADFKKLYITFTGTGFSSLSDNFGKMVKLNSELTGTPTENQIISVVNRAKINELKVLTTTTNFEEQYILFDNEGSGIYLFYSEPTSVSIGTIIVIAGIALCVIVAILLIIAIVKARREKIKQKMQVNSNIDESNILTKGMNDTASQENIETQRVSTMAQQSRPIAMAPRPIQSQKQGVVRSSDTQKVKAQAPRPRLSSIPKPGIQNSVKSPSPKQTSPKPNFVPKSPSSTAIASKTSNASINPTGLRPIPPKTTTKKQ